MDDLLGFLEYSDRHVESNDREVEFAEKGAGETARRAGGGVQSRGRSTG
jgi:hypothetical protein